MLQEVDRIRGLQDFDRILTQFSEPFCRGCDTSFAILRLGANGLLYSWPVLFLVRCQLQRGFDETDLHIRQSAYVGCSRRGLRVGKWRCRDKEASGTIFRKSTSLTDVPGASRFRHAVFLRLFCGFSTRVRNGM